MEHISNESREGAIPSMTVKQLANLVQAFTKVKGAVGYRSGYMLRDVRRETLTVDNIRAWLRSNISISTFMVYTLSQLGRWSWIVGRTVSKNRTFTKAIGLTRSDSE